MSGGRASKRVVIFGVGDFAQVAAVYLAEDSPYDVAAFTVHERFRTSEELLGKEVVAWEDVGDRYPPSSTAMLVAVGFSHVNKTRTRIYGECKGRGYEMITYVSSRVARWGDLTIGDNCFVFEDNVIQPFVRIGNNVVIWSGNHIGHHSTIEDNCFIASHAVISGHVTIGESSFVGVNATFRDGITVAPHCVIGASAVIVRDTEPSGVYKGATAELASYRSDELRNF